MIEIKIHKDNDIANRQTEDEASATRNFESEQRVALHLQMIQEPICRMSTTSAIIKGFSVTTTAGLIVSAITDNGYTPLLLSAIMTVPFMAMDIYYLKLERRFRHLFDLVRKGDRPADFSMELPGSPIELLQAKARTSDCLLSTSILPFYGSLIAAVIITGGLMFVMGL